MSHSKAVPIFEPKGSSATQAETDQSLDLLWGVDAIARELRLSRRQTYYQLELGRLPARKHSGKWCASRVGLRKYFANIIDGEIA